MLLVISYSSLEQRFLIRKKSDALHAEMERERKAAAKAAREAKKAAAEQGSSSAA